jgi:hypothetical protein
MKVLRGGSRVLWYESFGFLLLIGLSWISNHEGLSQYLFGGGPHTRDWRDSALQTVVILYVWAIVWGLTRMLLQRVYDLGTYLKLCAWCRKVGHRGKWMKIEDYFRQDFHIPTTHGMCPECKKRMEEETAEFIRKEKEIDKEAALQNSARIEGR